MSKLTDQIREYISSPQVDGNEHYGKWGALRKDQRLLIADLCEYCDLQEKYANTFFKETQSLKHQLAEKDKEIKRLKTIKAVENIRTQRTEIDGVEFTTEQISALQNVTIINKELIREEIEKEVRHQVCEEIRHEVQTYLRKNNLLKLELVFGIDFIIKQIEQGESK